LWVQTKLEKTPILDEKHVAAVVSIATGIPLSELTQDERLKLRNLQAELKKKVVGQDEPVEIVSQAIKRARAGVRHMNRPIGVFMFLGPTGVGKTQLAKALAETLYGSEDYLIRVDMSEFNERHNVARLIGSPPGYVGFEDGGQLTDKVRRKPFSIILFDEIEKAHPDVFNILLQVMDDGRMTDGHGLTIDFKNTIIIMTSNVGSEYIKQDRIGFNEVETGSEQVADEAYKSIKQRLEDSLKSNFRPEFLNRIDDIVVFRPLRMRDIEDIVDIELKQLTSLLTESGITIKFTPKAKKYIAESGYNVEMGARPIKRLIQKEVENAVSGLIIDNEAKKGDTITIDAGKHGLDIVVVENSKIAVSA
jgi:ATP-dependent Clp protease ATP-binding subunit ClpC